MIIIRSEMPGTFFRRANPHEAVYKDIGDPVAVGDTLGVIEIMKQYIEVTTDEVGFVAQFFVEDGEAIEVDQPLVEIISEEID